MPRLNLTATFCKSVEPETRRVYYWDTDTKGLGLMVTPKGQRSWVFQYRSPRGNDRRMKLGDYGHDLTLKEARAEAADKRAIVRKGGDPAEERRERQQAWTVAELYDYFMDGVPHPVREEERIGGYRNEPGKFPGTRRSPNSVREYVHIWERFILGAWGSRLVSSVTVRDLEVLHHDVSQISRVQADRVVKVLRRPFRLARKHGQYPPEKILPHEGLDSTQLNRVDGRPGVRYSESELAQIGEALLAKELYGQRAGIALAFLTGMRPPHEIVGARWDALRHEGRVLELTATKSGPRAVYLGNKASQIIEAQPTTTDDTILTSPFGGAFNDLNYQWRKVRAASKVPPRRRLYDARHTFKSIAEDLGIPRWRVDVLMGHSKSGAGTSGRYSHPDHEGLLRDAEEVSAEVWRLLTARVEPERARRVV